MAKALVMLRVPTTGPAEGYQFASEWRKPMVRGRGVEMGKRLADAKSRRRSFAGVGGGGFFELLSGRELQQPRVCGRYPALCSSAVWLAAPSPFVAFYVLRFSPRLRSDLLQPGRFV